MGIYKKHTSEFKLRLVKSHKQGSSICGLSKEWGVSTSQIREWVDHYNSSGPQGLLRKPYQKYAKEFKVTVVQAYLRKGLSLRDCCLHFRIPSIGIVSSWVKTYEHFGEDGLNARQKGRRTMKKHKPKTSANIPTRLEELERESLYLRAENELLKKLDALAQKKETPKRKKR
jgi:transposase